MINQLDKLDRLQYLGRQTLTDAEGLASQQVTFHTHEPIADENWTDLQAALQQLFPDATVRRYGRYLEIDIIRTNDAAWYEVCERITPLLPAPPAALPPAPRLSATPSNARPQEDPAQPRHRRHRRAGAGAGAGAGHAVENEAINLIEWQIMINGRQTTINSNDERVTEMTGEHLPRGRLFVLWAAKLADFAQPRAGTIQNAYDRTKALCLHGRTRPAEGFDGLVYNSQEGWKVKNRGDNVRVTSSHSALAVGGQKLLCMDTVHNTYHP